MSVYVFAGPTLPAAHGRDVLAQAVFLPPAGQGDLYRATRDGARAIGLIDGYFERIPAVWHKEILWALSQGVHVFGAASMGALRAAELHTFGMEGVGTIFAAFRDGVLEDDDEVAVAHGAAETGYLALSDAMVNIRPTLQAARAAGLLQDSTREALERLAKGLHYSERGYPVLLSRARSEGLPAGELQALQDFLPQGRIDQKRQDALAMLHRMRERLAEGLPPPRVRYTFEHTDAWEQLVQSVSPARLADSEEVATAELLEELAVEGQYASVLRGAALRALALAEARRHGVKVSREQLRAAVDAFRVRHGAEDADAARRWLEEQGLDSTGFHHLMEEEARLAWVHTVFSSDFTRTVPAHLRASGEYGEWARRARDKRRVLESRGLLHPTLADARLGEEQLWTWYFQTRLATPAPPDLRAYARTAGFESRDDLRRAVLREYCYVQWRGESPC